MDIKYDNYIKNIIKTRGQWGISKKEYFEGHHIIPKCFGGKGYTKSKNKNIIWLFPQEHFMAHKLLLFKYPNNFKLIAAYWHMCNKNYKCSADEYKFAKEKYSKELSKRLRGHRVSKETREKLRKANKGHKPWNAGKTNVYSKDNLELRRKIGKKNGIKTAGWNKGKKMIGYINYGMTNKHHTEETKRKLSIQRKGNHPKSEYPSKIVLCIETNKKYPSVNQAMRETGIKHISGCCRKERKTAGGYHWIYL